MELQAANLLAKLVLEINAEDNECSAERVAQVSSLQTRVLQAYYLMTILCMGHQYLSTEVVKHDHPKSGSIW
jgi:hypothetical protein